MASARAFVCLGVIALGYKVINTVGHRLAIIDLHTGFCMIFGGALTLMTFTILNIPVSATHCQVGSVVFVGICKNGFRNVQWSMFGRICLTWIITVPFSALLS